MPRRQRASVGGWSGAAGVSVSAGVIALPMPSPGPGLSPSYDYYLSSWMKCLLLAVWMLVGCAVLIALYKCLHWANLLLLRALFNVYDRAALAARKAGGHRRTTAAVIGENSRVTGVSISPQSPVTAVSSGVSGSQSAVSVTTGKGNSHSKQHVQRGAECGNSSVGGGSVRWRGGGVGESCSDSES